MTTLAAFYAALSTLTVAGTTRLTEPPLKVETAQMPALFVDMVSATDVSSHKGNFGGNRVLTGRVVILMGVAGQDLHATRWSETIAMADTLTAALVAMTNPTGQGLVSWDVNVTPNLDNSGYWAVFANVTATEW